MAIVAPIMISTTGQPILQTDVAGNPFNAVFGRPIVISESQQSIAAGNSPILFGDLKRGYVLRQPGTILLSATVVLGGTMYQNLARNRTYTGNVIFSPNASLLFSLEYRHLESIPVIGLPAESNIIGVAAGCTRTSSITAIVERRRQSFHAPFAVPKLAMKTFMRVRSNCQTSFCDVRGYSLEACRERLLPG
jgi:hypothetical protein